MSLEIAIQENTSAIRELIAAIANGIPTTNAQVAAVVAETPTKAKAPTKAKEPETTLPGKAVWPFPTPGVQTLTVDFETVKKPFLALVNKKGRDAGVAILTAFGVPTGGKLGDIPVEKFAEALAAIEKASM